MNSNREVSGHQRIIEKTCRSHGANKKKFEQHCFWQPVDTHVPCQALIRLTTSNRTKFFVQQHVSHTSSKLETEHKSLLTSASFKEASKKKNQPEHDANDVMPDGIEQEAEAHHRVAPLPRLCRAALFQGRHSSRPPPFATPLPQKRQAHTTPAAHLVASSNATCPRGWHGAQLAPTASASLVGQPSRLAVLATATRDLQLYVALPHRQRSRL